MNWLQRIIVLIWGVLVALKFNNIPKYVEVGTIKMKVDLSDSYFKSMQTFNDYSSIIPSIVIYTVIAIVLFLVVNKLKIEIKKKKIFDLNWVKNISSKSKIFISVCFCISVISVFIYIFNDNIYCYFSHLKSNLRYNNGIKDDKEEYKTVFFKNDKIYFIQKDLVSEFIINNPTAIKYKEVSVEVEKIIKNMERKDYKKEREEISSSIKSFKPKYNQFELNKEKIKGE
jgi:large-conductance mechanosensitive channel